MSHSKLLQIGLLDRCREQDDIRKECAILGSLDPISLLFFSQKRNTKMRLSPVLILLGIQYGLVLVPG
jgi:hypothetical protein